jgi:hypothetical protein
MTTIRVVINLTRKVEIPSLSDRGRGNNSSTLKPMLHNFTSTNKPEKRAEERVLTQRSKDFLFCLHCVAGPLLAKK